MKISRSDFKERLENGQLKLSFIGMSNIGKTLWSTNLTKLDFEHICCDDLVEDKLGPELQSLGYKGIEDVAKWLGQPYDERFKANQAKYLEQEISVMQEILSNDIEGNTAVDSTGSVIYCGEEIMQKLKEKSLIVYIEATEEMKEKMFENFIKHPKPIVWGESFNLKDGENEMEALKRCYPELLAYRSSLYEKYADIRLPYYQADALHINNEQFLENLQLHLN